KMEISEHIQRPEVARIDTQDFAIQLDGFSKIAGLLHAKSGCEQRLVHELRSTAKAAGGSPRLARSNMVRYAASSPLVNCAVSKSGLVSRFWASFALTEERKTGSLASLNASAS